MDCCPPGSSVHGVFQARTLEWVAFPSPEDLPDPGIKPRALALKADSLPSEPPYRAPNTCTPFYFLSYGIEAETREFRWQDAGILFGKMKHTHLQQVFKAM